MKAEDCSFYSGPGVKLAGRLYLPDPARATGAGIVFCHGFGGVKEGTPPGLSSILAAHGYTVLAFDYRGFGASEGARGRLVPCEQVEDAVHALAFLSRRAGVDPARLGVYGTSFGGGIAIMAARRSGLARAAIVTVPVTSGSRWLQSIMRHYEFQAAAQRALDAIAKKAVTGTIEQVNRFEIMVPDPITQRRYSEPFTMALETFYHVVNHEPIAEAGDLDIPVAVIGVRGDPLVPFQQAVDLHARLPGPKQFSALEGDNHFVVYETALEDVGKISRAWFDEHVAAASAKATA